MFLSPQGRKYIPLWPTAIQNRGGEWERFDILARL
jgi:hypothetical protein